MLGLIFLILAPMSPMTGYSPAETSTVEISEALSGSDFLLINEAYKHPEIRGRDLGCYDIHIFREKGIRRVAFIGHRPTVREIEEGDQKALIYPGPNPKCPSRSFEMDASGKVRRVIYERH